MKLSYKDKIMLGKLTTRDEAGRHFAETYSSEWLKQMELAGYITIHRPVHDATGIPYDVAEWSVDVSECVADWFDNKILSESSKK